jgi:enoyl-[acyl-carrier protein] reductase II
VKYFNIMKKTIICELLEIKYPIIQGGMLWLATAELAAAASNAGALGVISPLSGMEMEGDPSKNLADQLARIKHLTDKPNFTEVLRKKGIKVIHVVSSVKQAKKAESCAVDGVIAVGIEAAAHHGRDELPLFSLLPQVSDAISIPVIAAGGISDARGIAAAFALGAEGVQLGTRFVAVEENIAHPNYKQAIIDARDADTVITCRQIVPARSLKTQFTNRLSKLEDSGASDQDLMDFIGYRRNRISQIQGHLDKGEAYCGASAGLIKEVLTVQEVVDCLVKGYEKIVKQLPQSLK